MRDLVTINGEPAPFRRDLHGTDATYELILLLDRLQPGDTLIIDRTQFRRMGGNLSVVIVPPYPHKRWVDDDDMTLRVQRLAK